METTCHLRRIPFLNIGPRPVVDILTEIDYAELHCVLGEIKGDPGDPIASQTPLGWTCISSIKIKESRVYQLNFVRA